MLIDYIKRKITIALVVIFAVTALFGYYRLSESPAVWYDEGFYSVIALTLARHGEFAVQAAPGVFESAGKMSSGFTLIFPVAAMLKIFGGGVFAARMFMPLYIIGVVALAYLFLRRKHDSWIALSGAALLATMPVLYGNGKSVLGEVPGLFFLLLTLFLTDRLVSATHRRWLYFFATAIAAGLAFISKPIYMPIIVVLACVMIVMFRPMKITVREILAASCGFLLPVLLWVVTQFNDTDTVAAIFHYFTNPYETESTANLVLQNLKKLITVPSSLYTTATLVVWGASVAVRLLYKQRIFVAEWVALIFAAMIMGNYLKMPGWSRYFFPAQMLALVFLAPSIKILVDRTAKTHAQTLFTYAVILLVGIQLSQLAWFSYVAQYYESQRSEKYTAYFKQLGPHKSVFLFNAPEVAVFLSSDNFYLYAPVHSSWSIGEGQLKYLREGIPDMVVVTSATRAAHAGDFGKYTLQDKLPNHEVLRRINEKE